MAELKRTFLDASMNKDTDPRLVQPNTYIDARNVHVVPTEGGTAGTVHLFKGTKALLDLESDWVIIGLYEDKPNDLIYIFATDGTENRIYTHKAKVDGANELILNDLNGILGWKTTTVITGVQMIEKSLGWVAEKDEPCVIEPQSFKAGTTDTATHSQYESRDFILSDITMIRKGPRTAPNVITSRSKRDGVVVGLTSKNFTVAALNDNSFSDALPVGTVVPLSFAGTGSAFVEGDRIKLTTEAPDDDDIELEYEVTLLVTSSTSGGSVVSTTIVSITQTLEDAVLDWDLELVEGETLYELEFPRFAYRWKFKNDQYSTISPFTQVVFDPDEFDYDSKKGYNLGMLNQIRRIILSGLEGTVDFPIPEDVSKIDILVKNSRSNTIYVVDTIDPVDTFEISNELISKVVQSNQILRPSDIVPKSAKALEAVGNRFVLGNYVQGYNTNELVQFGEATVLSNVLATTLDPLPSLKSNRTLQAGVTFLDEFGRETPVLTDKSGVFEITKEESNTANSVRLQMAGVAPTWADSFKYYIKDASNEYYNLAADKLYKTEEATNSWVSFPSSERNKIDLETYLYLKKEHDSDTPIFGENRFKVLGIENEAPEEIKKAYEEVFASSVIFDNNFGSGILQDTMLLGSTPARNGKSFNVASNQSAANQGVTGPMVQVFKDSVERSEELYIRFISGSSRSDYYKVAKYQSNKPRDFFAGITGVTGEYLKVFVDEAFGEDIDFLYTDPGDETSTLVNNSVQVELYIKKLIKDQAQFQGRFFVRLSTNSLLLSSFTPDSDLITLTAATCRLDGYGNEGNVLFDTVFNLYTNFKIHAGGAFPKLDYSTQFFNGGLAVDRPEYWCDDNTDTIFDIVFEKRHRTPQPTVLIDKIQQVGTKIRFTGGVGGHSQVYTIVRCSPQTARYKNNSYTRYWTVLDPPLQQSVNPQVTGEEVTVEVLEAADEFSITSTNPAIFETEPKEAIDLDLYYEASDAFPIAEFSDLKELDYFNCFTFGNGVESNRIRDDFNAPTIDKGPKASTVTDDPYAEEKFPNGLIFSGIYNSNTGVNRLNQFIAAEPITKFLSPAYGPIQLLHARNSDLITFCEDKVIKVLANKDALYNADGNVNITANKAVLGQSIPFAGEYGISTNPASFASYGNRIYFSDKKRGALLRLSQNGIIEIAGAMSSYVEDQLANNSNIRGSYDVDSDYYMLSFGNNISVCFSESAKGITTILEETIDNGISVNDVFYTTKGDKFVSNTDEVNRNNFYGVVKPGSISVVFNDQPSAVKKFLTASYEGSDGWDASSFNTNLQEGNVLPFVEKEGKFYNHIKGNVLTWDNGTQLGIDPKQFNIQGIGQVSGISGDVTRDYIMTVKDNPADH